MQPSESSAFQFFGINSGTKAFVATPPHAQHHHHRLCYVCNSKKWDITLHTRHRNLMRRPPLVQQRLIPCIVLLLILAASAFGDPEKDPQVVQRLQDARQSIDARRPADAIKQCDEVIASFKTHYGGSKQKIFCARTPPESLGYLLQAAHDEISAVVLSSTWADAYFMKTYALLDLRRIAEAKTTIQHAVALSPRNSQYLSEFGTICQLEKDWANAKKQFEAAEDSARLSPENLKADELGRARRGLGYVFVELGELDKAAKKYQQCLADNPNDTRAKRELEYVRSLQARRKHQ